MFQTEGEKQEYQKTSVFLSTKACKPVIVVTINIRQDSNCVPAPSISLSHVVSVIIASHADL